LAPLAASLRSSAAPWRRRTRRAWRRQRRRRAARSRRPPTPRRRSGPLVGGAPTANGWAATEAGKRHKLRAAAGPRHAVVQPPAAVALARLGLVVPVREARHARVLRAEGVHQAAAAQQPVAKGLSLLLRACQAGSMGAAKAATAAQLHWQGHFLGVAVSGRAAWARGRTVSLSAWGVRADLQHHHLQHKSLRVQACNQEAHLTTDTDIVCNATQTPRAHTHR